MQDGVQIVRFDALEPSWAVKRATEPGYMRWLVSWLGGAAGFVNFNPGVALQSDQAAMGFMYMPAGNRQAGLHKHTVAEIYVILQGEIEGFDHTGVSHRAGPLDCIAIPAGVPHGVRTVGTTDLHLVWVHDGPERVGQSVYMDGASPGDSADTIQIVHFAGQEPLWTQDDPASSSTACRRIGYLGNGSGEAANTRVRLGLTTIPSGHQHVIDAADHARTAVCTAGRVTAFGRGAPQTFGYLDAVHVPTGVPARFINHANLPARMLWLDKAAP
jgi:mannose-6-phosphate isomerase-like protein (cupin superfamily)